jgi:D-aminopeptidase
MGRLLHPSETGPAIERAAENGIKKLGSIKPKVYAEPTHVKIEFNRTEMTDMCAKLISVSRVDAYTVEGTYSSYLEAHKVVWNLLALSGVGVENQW